MKKLLKKYQSWIYFGLILGAIGVAIFLLSGCASHPPTALEQRWFNIQTNPPVISVVTNVIQVTVLKTNEVTMLPEPQIAWRTNTVTVTNVPESYVYTPGTGAKAIQETGTAVGNIFGVGGLVGTGLGALFSLWGYLRSRKQYVTAANIAQTVEVMREFIKGLPNGAAYDNELVNFMTTNQANAGVLQNVISLISKEVSNTDAKAAADNVKRLIEGLQAGTVPKPPI